MTSQYLNNLEQELKIRILFLAVVLLALLVDLNLF